MIYEEAKTEGIIPMPPRLLTDLHQYELEGTALNIRFQEIQKQASARCNNYLEEVCGVDLEVEKWIPEVDKRRFRRADVRPPELRPENEVKPVPAHPDDPDWGNATSDRANGTQAAEQGS